MPENDPVRRPAHYAGNGKVACMDAIRSMLAGYARSLSMVGNTIEAAYWSTCALKYIWRWPAKNGVQDLEKARQCIGYAIDALRPEDRDAPFELEKDSTNINDSHKDFARQCIGYANS